MVQTNFMSQRTRIRQPKASIVRDMSKGQRNNLQPDKLSWDTFQTVMNMYPYQGNAVLRPGYEQLLGADDILGGHIHDKEGDKELYIAQINGTDTDIVKVDRTAGTTSVKFSITGTGDVDFTSLNGILYVCNGVDNLIAWNGTTKSSYTFPLGKPTLIEADKSRIWVSSTKNLLYFSQAATSGAIPSPGFDTSGSSRLRAGLANSKITDFISLLNVGRYMLVFSKNRIESHIIPDFSGVDTDNVFFAGVETFRSGVNNMGITNKDACIEIGGLVYFKKQADDILRSCQPSGSNLNIKSTQKFGNYLGEILWSNAKMGYWEERNMLFMSGVKDEVNNVVFGINLETGEYGEFSNIFPDKFIFDQNNVYWIESERFIQSLTANSFNDNGAKIEWSLLTQADYGGDIDNYKKIHEIFLHTRVFENIDIFVDVFVDKRVFGLINPNLTIELENIHEEDLFLDDPSQDGSHGLLGGALVKFSDDVGSEKVYNSQKINRLYHRIELQYRGSSEYYIEIKGQGKRDFPTNKRVKTITYK